MKINIKEDDEALCKLDVNTTYLKGQFLLKYVNYT